MFLAIGLGLLLIISVFFFRGPLWARAVIAVLLAGIGIFALTTLVGFQSHDVSTRGGNSWWDSSPWKELTLLIAMIIGMFLRVTWDAVEEHQRQAKKGGGASGPTFDFWSWVSPAVVSLIVFQPVLSMGENQPMSIKLTLFSLQNGFFWNTILAKVRRSSGR
jgi:hypothetical protein